MILLSGLFIKAYAMGFAISAPIGPIGMLCIRKTLTFGLRGAMAVGLGASIAKVIYGMLTGAGITSVSDLFLQNIHIIKIIGGILLGYLGFKELTRSHHTPEAIASAPSFTWLKTFCSTCALTLSNPMTIICFLGFISTLAGESFALHDSFIFSAGIFCGSMTWWFILGCIIAVSRSYIPQSWIIGIQATSASMLICLGIWASMQGMIALM